MVIVCANRTFHVERGGRMVEKRGFYMNRLLYHNLKNYFVPAVAKKWDGVLLFTGIEGSGKSTMASTVGRFCGGKDFGIDNIVFTQQQFFDAIENAPPGTCIVFDEAAMAALAQDAATGMQIALIKKFITIRKKALFIFLVLPSIFMLRRYFAIFRTRALIHTYTPDGLSRGMFKFYSYDTKRLLYIRGIKEFDQMAAPPDFKGSFSDTFGYFFDVKEYDRKKEEAIRSITAEQGKDSDTVAGRVRKSAEERDIAVMAAYHLWKRMYLEKFGGTDKLKKEPVSPKNFSNFLLRNYGMDIKPSRVTAQLNEAARVIIAQRQERAVQEEKEKVEV